MTTLILNSHSYPSPTAVAITYYIAVCCGISELDGIFKCFQKSTTRSVSFQQSRTIKRESSEGYISDKSSSNEAVDQLSPEATERAGRGMK